MIQSMDMHSPVSAMHESIISDLQSTFSDSLHIQDATKSEHASEGNDNCNVGEGNLCGGFEQQETNMKCLKKGSTFPYPDMMLPLSSSDQEVYTSLKESLSEKSPHQMDSCSVSSAAPRKLVSAMKGSREKHGGSQMKLIVKWAPDVYDPVPTLLSHTVRSKKQQKSRIKKSDKKNGKKGQKGNFSQGGSGRLKNRFRKLGGNSHLCHKSPDSRDKVIETCTESDDFDVGYQDSYCGTSFLKKSVSIVRLPVAEAM